MSADTPTDHDRVHASLAAIVAHHAPTNDGWAAIQARLAAETGGDALPVLAPIGAPTSRRRRPSPPALVAAVVVVLAGIAGAVALARPDHQPSTVEAGAGAATGWYVPVGLPAGWRLETVTLDREPYGTCPCLVRLWQSSDRRKGVLAIRQGEVQPEVAGRADDPRVLALPDGTRGSYSRHGDEVRASWSRRGMGMLLLTRGFDRRAVVRIAQALDDEPKRASLPVGRLGRATTFDQRSATGYGGQVEVTLRSPAGNDVRYTLASPPTALVEVLESSRAVRLAGQPLPVLARPRADDPTGSRYLGRWPGATVEATGMVDHPDTRITNATNAEVRTLVSSLRPVTAAGWRAFLATAPARDLTLGGYATHGDLVADRPDAAPPASPVGSIADLDLRLTVGPQVVHGDEAEARLRVANPTRHRITDPTCAVDHARLAIVTPGADGPTQADGGADPAAWHRSEAPCDGGLDLAPGEVRTLSFPLPTTYGDPRQGPLPVARYDALAAIEGVPRLRTAIDVGGADCVAFATGLEPGYVGLTTAEARALATSEGRKLQILPASPTARFDDRAACGTVRVLVARDRVTFARRW